MPIYEYECRGCGKTFEVFQKHSDPPPAKHECGSSDLQRIMSRTSFVLKGSGWYVTDYARKEKKSDGGDDKGGKGGGDKSDKSEPKPDKAA